MALKSNYKYIEFDEAGYNIWGCTTKSGIAIGHVKYYASWKQCCFFPNNGTVFSGDCLADIQHFLGQLNEIAFPYHDVLEI